MRRASTVLARNAVFACALEACGAFTAVANTIRVPADQPTIQAGIVAASPGDTVLASPGTYIENVNFLGKAVVLASKSGPAATTLKNAGAYETAVVIIGPNGAISGFTITGGQASFGSGMEVHGTGAVIQHNVFDGNAEGGGGFGAAIGGNGASALIDANVFRNNSCDNQFLSGVVAFVNGSSPVITNNLFVDNPCRAIDMTLPMGSQPRVVNNTMVGNRTGIYVDTRVQTSQQIYRNNILFGNTIGLEIAFGSPSTAPTFDHNLVFGNGTNYSGTGDHTGVAGNLSTDPRFVNTAARDLHLSPGSPAIDAGSSDGAPPFDFDGVSRPLDGNSDAIAAYDIGAYEWFDIPTPVLASLIDASVDDEGVRLRWWVPQLANSGGMVLRSQRDGAWSSIGTAIPVSSDEVDFRDPNVQPGHVYGYRLVGTAASQPFVTSDAWIAVPGPKSLALEAVSPVLGAAPRLRVTLPDNAPATLMVTDIAGRRRASLPVSMLGAGTHALVLEPLPPGIYLATLTQSGERRSTKLVVAR
jgi:hypothetical protein